MTWGDALKSAAAAVAEAVGKAPSGAKLTPDMVIAEVNSGGELALAATLAAMRRAEADARESLKASLAAADATLAFAAELLGTALPVSVTQAKNAIDDAGQSLGGLFQDELGQARAGLDGAVSVAAHGALGAMKEARAWLAPTDDPKALPLAARGANAARVLGKVIELLAIGAHRELEALPPLLQAPAAARREAADVALARALGACQGAGALVRAVVYELLEQARGTAAGAQVRMQDTEAKTLAAARLEAERGAAAGGAFAQRVAAVLEQVAARFAAAPLALPVEGEAEEQTAAVEHPAAEARRALLTARGAAIGASGAYLAQCAVALQAVGGRIETYAADTLPRAAAALDPVIAARDEASRVPLLGARDAVLAARDRLDGEIGSAVRHASAAAAKLRGELDSFAPLFDAAATAIDAAAQADAPAPSAALKPIAEAAAKLANGTVRELAQRIAQAAAGLQQHALGALGEARAALDGLAGDAATDPALGEAREAIAQAAAAANDSLLPALNTARTAADALAHCLRERPLAGLREVARLTSRAA